MVDYVIQAKFPAEDTFKNSIICKISFSKDTTEQSS